MNDPLYLLTPDELIRANTQINLLKQELERNVLVEPSGKETESETTDTFLESMAALGALQKKSDLCSVYELIEKPPFQLDTELTDHEVRQALTGLLQRMARCGILLKMLAPDDYSERTIYRFISNELFLYETYSLGKGETIQFVYEEFHQNHRYNIVEQGNKFVKMLVEGNFDQLNRCLAEQFLARQTIPCYTVSVRPEVTDHLNDLIEGWWPQTLRGGSCANVLIADDTETAKATLQLHMGMGGDPDYLPKESTIFLSRYDLWWVIERREIDEWVLK